MTYIYILSHYRDVGVGNGKGEWEEYPEELHHGLVP